MLNIQRHLRESDLTPQNMMESLKADLGIKTFVHPVHSNLIQFHYDQLESPRSHPIVNECRGLILDSANNWDVVAAPFWRFFNAEEDCAAEIDWDSAHVQEKLDGSLMILYYYKYEWFVATKQSPTASGNMGTEETTFAEMFWSLLSKETLAKLRPNLTYMFEMMTPENRVVVHQTDRKLVLLRGRERISLKEISAAGICGLLPKCEITPVGDYPLTSIEEVNKAAEAIDPMKGEGFVVVDANNNRIKIKSPKYVQIHRLKDGFNTRRIIELIQMGETNEILAYFPEYREQYRSIENQLGVLIAYLQMIYDRYKDLESHKDFALAIQKETTVTAPLFAARKRGKTIKEGLFEMRAKQLETMLIVQDVRRLEQKLGRVE